MKKNEVQARNSVIDDLKQQEKKMESVLDEISNVAVRLYGDIEHKEKELERMVNEVKEKCAFLNRQQDNSISHNSTTFPNQRVGSDKENNPIHSEHESIQEKVYTLSDQGFNILEIAKMVSKQKGEIELILNLRKVHTKSHEYSSQ